MLSACLTYIVLASFAIIFSVLISLATCHKRPDFIHLGWIILSIVCLLIILFCFGVLVGSTPVIHQLPSNSATVRLL